LFVFWGGARGGPPVAARHRRATCATNRRTPEKTGPPRRAGYRSPSIRRTKVWTLSAPALAHTPEEGGQRMVTIESTPEHVARVYQTMERNLHVVRQRLGRPLTLADKLLLGHLDSPDTHAL